MKYTVTTPPTGTLLDYKTIATHLRLDETEDIAYVNSLQDVAIDYAQDAMAVSILAQTITAVFTVNDVQPATRYPMTLGANYFGTAPLQIYQSGMVIALPRGPMTAITSVTDAKGTAIVNYAIERQGYEDILRIAAAASFLLTVVYVAGYADAAHVPPGIKQGILMHVGTLYENRESITDRPKTIVPHGLEAFYARKAHKTSVG